MLRGSMRLAISVPVLAALGNSSVIEIQQNGNFHATVHSHSSTKDESQAQINEEGLAEVEQERLLRAQDQLSPEFVGTHDIAHQEDISDLLGKKKPSSTKFELDAPSGVVPGACANFRKTGDQDASVSCPNPLKMVGCSCRDKEGQNTGSCGTKFSAMETCNAFTKVKRTVTAYVRCCNIDDIATKFSIETSKPSGEKDGDGAEVQCPAESTLLGCACLPADAPNNGCKHTKVNGDRGCLATNLKGHKKGVKAQALCAVVEGSTGWETVQLTKHVEKVSSNLSCSDNGEIPKDAKHAKLHMISCSCGGSTGQCNGGKVLGNRCECSGAKCFASARCANIPVPKTNCHWNFWGEWSDCSVSCGNGTMSRVREIAMIAMNGGDKCVGSFNQTSNCSGDATARECNATNITRVAEVPMNHTILIVTASLIGVLGLGGIGAKAYSDKYAGQRDDDGEKWGEGEWSGEGWSGGGEGEWGKGGEADATPMFFDGGK